MITQTTRYLLALCGLLAVFVLGCDKSPTGPDTMIDSGSWYESGYRWPHDGHPVESAHFVIYSDAASLEARQQLSQICEDGYSVITEKLGITDFSILQFPADRNDKIHIYAYKNYYPTSWGGQAFYGGFLIFSIDHPQRSQLGLTALEYYVPLVRHELMHTIQTLILGANDERILWSWFAEGIAIEIANDIFYDRIDSKQHLDSLTTQFGMLNPLSIRYSWTAPTTPQGVGTTYLYPMYWLSVRYLLDPGGRGGSFYDVRDVLIDAAHEIPFDTSLKNRFGISQQEFEAQYFTLMDTYLP